MRVAVVSFVLLLGCGAADVPGTTVLAPDGSRVQAPIRPLAVGVNQAMFTPEDPANDEGAFIHVWHIELAPPQRVRIRVQSGAVDPMIEVHGPGELHLRNDDGLPGTLDAMVDFVPPVAGTYEIRTTTVSPRSVGPYVIFVEPRDPAGIGPQIAVGQRATVNLGEHMQPQLPGSWLHFEGQAGSIVRIRVTSQAFDTVATMIGPGGQTWFNDDANDLGADRSERALDSTIVAALPATGVYQLIVTSYGGQGRGPFNVRAEVRPPVVIGPRGERPDGLAGMNGGGRVLGLYAGITAYENNSQLFGCADDARLLAQAMRESHLQSESDQLVLPDSLATRDAFLGGLAQIAANARPEDVVLIFFSGHGNQVPEDSTGAERELDDLDETIVFYDQPLLDDQLVSAVAPIRAQTIILAIDACHSGGFDDFVSRPGRMGLFSSDEDVLSDTAEPRGAGGYLSWHLRRGVLGEADARPHDGVLHAGELSDYILDGYVTDHRLMNPPHEIDRAQRLVVRRGSVVWDRLLWIYPRNPDLTLPPLPNVPLTTMR
jgi:hypothetical protein